MSAYVTFLVLPLAYKDACMHSMHAHETILYSHSLSPTVSCAKALQVSVEMGFGETAAVDLVQGGGDIAVNAFNR